MVKEVTQNTSTKLGASNQTLFQCEECGLKYKDRNIAEKCEAWCREHKSCNLEIIQSAEKENA